MLSVSLLGQFGDLMSCVSWCLLLSPALCCTLLLVHSHASCFLFLPPIRNTMPDFGSEVMAEALAQRALVKPVYTIPVIPLSSSNQYRHQDHLDMKDYKKVSVCGSCC